MEELRDASRIARVREDFADESAVFYGDGVGMEGDDLSEDIRTRQKLEGLHTGNGCAASPRTTTFPLLETHDSNS